MKITVQHRKVTVQYLKTTVRLAKVTGRPAHSIGHGAKLYGLLCEIAVQHQKAIAPLRKEIFPLCTAISRR
jgi:hypothetical protein